MVSGFGLTEKGTPSKKLKFTQINLRPASFCEKLLENNRKFDNERFLCGIGHRKTAVARQDACQGDSGGPLIAKVLDENHKEKFTLVGIVSFGNGAGKGVFQNCGSFGAYTKVSKYLSFIRDPVHNLFNRETQSPEPIHRSCRILNLSRSSLFDVSSPCRLKCNAANQKCTLCKQLLDRKQSNSDCLDAHEILFGKCKRCITNPHNFTQPEILRIKELNNLKYNDDLFGETLVTIPNMEFSLHNIHGDHEQSRLDHEFGVPPLGQFENLKVTFGSTAQPKQIPWQVQFINYGELKCGGTLVTPNKIVSAAHCFCPEKFPQTKTEPERPSLDYLTARAGNAMSQRGAEGSQTRKCTYIILHS